MAHEMSRKDREDILRTCKLSLLENLTVTNKFWTSLSEQSIFTDEMVQSFRKGRGDDLLWMLDELPKRGHDALAKFIEVLHNTGHPCMAKLLQSRQEDVTNARLAPSRPHLKRVSSDFAGKVNYETDCNATEQIGRMLTNVKPKNRELEQQMTQMQQHWNTIQKQYEELNDLGATLRRHTVATDPGRANTRPTQSLLERRDDKQRQLMQSMRQYEYILNAVTGVFDSVLSGSTDDAKAISATAEKPRDVTRKFDRVDSSGMAEEHREILRFQKTDLLKNITATEEFWTALSKDIFTDDMVQTIRAGKTENEKISRMLDELPKRGPEAFQQFLGVLESTGHGHVAGSLRDQARVSGATKL